MKMEHLIEQLGNEWDSDGFLGHVRIGRFPEKEAADFLKLLRSIDIDDNAEVPKRLLSLLWYLPTFLVWQRERVGEAGGDVNKYDHFITEVHNILEGALGVP